MRPFSADLRQRIVDVHESGEEISIRQIAKRFRVSKNFVSRLIRRFQDTGSIEPCLKNSGRTPILKAEHLEVLDELVKKHSEATIKVLTEMLCHRCGLQVSSSTVCRALQKMRSD